MMSPMYPSEFPVTFQLARCSSCRKQTDAHGLIIVHAKEWKDCRSGGSSPVVCNSCLVGYNIPVVRPSTGNWEFGKVLSSWDSPSNFQTGDIQQINQHLIEFYDKTKEWVFVENDPYDAYVRHFDKIFSGVNEDDGSWKKTMIGTSPSMDQNEIHSLDQHSVNGFHSLDTDATHQLSPMQQHPQKEYDSQTSPFMSDPVKFSAFRPTSPFMTNLENYSMVAKSPRNDVSPEKKKQKLDLSPNKRLFTFPDCQLSSLSNSETTSPDRSSISSTGRESRMSSSTARTAKMWTTEEDNLLLNAIESMNNELNWPKIALNVPDRTGKQCRERYLNHLGPHLKRTEWTPVEDARIFQLYATYGSKWSQMVRFLPGRTDNGIKNRYHHLRRRFEKKLDSTDESNELKIAMAQIQKKFSLQKLPMELIKNTAAIIVGDDNIKAGDHSDYKFGPFREVDDIQGCARCGLMMPSRETGSIVCEATGWCETCTRVSVVFSGDLVRFVQLVRE